MTDWSWRTVLVSVLISLACFCMVGGCDTGEKVVDEVAGNRALKQYHKSKNDIEKISRRQAEKYGTIPGDDEKGDGRK